MENKLLEALEIENYLPGLKITSQELQELENYLQNEMLEVAKGSKMRSWRLQMAQDELLEAPGVC